jgi:auxin-responsive protein IAA
MEVGTKKEKMGFEETELRLGLPGNGATTHEGAEVARKRGFSETETETTTVDLKLNLSSKEPGRDPTTEKLQKEKNCLLTADPAKHPAK